MHISSVYSPLELTYSTEIPLTDAKNTAQLLTFRSLAGTGKPPPLIPETNLWDERCEEESLLLARTRFRAGGSKSGPVLVVCQNG